MTEQCLLSFKIGSFGDQVLCYVVGMDACHVLLVRPWMFYRKVFHFGMEDTYEFKKDGQRYRRLEPMAEEVVIATDSSGSGSSGISSSRVMLCSAKQFLGNKIKHSSVWP